MLSRKVPPSMISVSLRGPSLVRPSSFLISSSFLGSTWANTPSASASSLASVTGTCTPSAITLPSLR
ncbi:Uncharacterised protein [Mycobacteroides abscessus subsp. abscessus]|nr:Uncharacterised protein [Mycobacteroides abscessus subsp. abscessus]